MPDVTVIDSSPFIGGALLRELEGHGVEGNRLTPPLQSFDDVAATTLVRVETTKGCVVVERLREAGVANVAVLIPEACDARFVMRFLLAGATTVLPSTVGLEQLLSFIRDPSPVALVPRAFLETLIDGQPPEPFISKEERSWLVRLSAGATVRALAASAGYSERSMHRRLGQVYRSLGADGRSAAIMTAASRGLLSNPDRFEPHAASR